MKKYGWLKCFDDRTHTITFGTEFGTNPPYFKIDNNIWEFSIESSTVISNTIVRRERSRVPCKTFEFLYIDSHPDLINKSCRFVLSNGTA